MLCQGEVKGQQTRVAVLGVLGEFARNLAKAESERLHGISLFMGQLPLQRKPLAIEHDSHLFPTGGKGIEYRDLLVV